MKKLIVFAALAGLSLPVLADTAQQEKMKSCNAEASTAARMLLRVSQAQKMANNVLSPNKGIKPKKIPIATPPAIACGVSRIARSFSECSCNQRRAFMRLL